MSSNANNDEPRKLAVFDSKRKEIEYRTNAQHTLITLNLTAIATIGAFALTKDGDHRLLLLFPILCPAMGMLWLDHAITIDSIGDYIRDTLKIDAEWETKVENQRKKWLGSLNFGAQVIVLFGGPAFGALLQFYFTHHMSPGIPHLRDLTSWLFNIGAILLLWFLGTWYYQFMYRYWADRKRRLVAYLRSIRSKFSKKNKVKGASS